LSETKVRIHKITRKASLKYCSEAWMLKKRDTETMKAAQEEFL
jgi:hypothetical protein